MRALLGVLLGSVAVTSACSVSDQSRSGESPLDSNGPQTDQLVSSIFKLTTPPLLETATPGPNGVMVIDAAASAQIESEQQAFIAGLAKYGAHTKVLYKYRLVLNAVAILAPRSVAQQLESVKEVRAALDATVIAPPRPFDEDDGLARSFAENSVKWIGATKARTELGLTGHGVTVGVIDTGIDYTHKMFGGPGTPQAYSTNSPAKIEPGTFPTHKVVGGKDFVGTTYDASSAIEANRIPQPDDDPLDEQGHGSHVAGTIAGVGDDVNTYDGVAPDVVLHALKVFGKGSTSQPPVFAALEYAADPNGDGDLSDRLDVVNLSLGSSWGTHLGLYEEVARTLSRGGTLFVAAAGNAGPQRYIVGSPSTVDDAISVAASTYKTTPTSGPDRLSSFSSWGPRSIDGAFKPEVAAPGSNVISALMGGGDRGTSKGGTSMASPHIAGVAALLRQLHPHATTAQLKSLIMNSGTGMKDANGAVYAASKQGAGRVQVFESATAKLTFEPPAIGLGIVDGNVVTQGQRTITVSNLTNAPVHSTLAWPSSGSLRLSGPAVLDVPANGTANLTVDYAIDVTTVNTPETEIEAQVLVTSGTSKMHVPALAVATRGSDIRVTAPALAAGPVTVALANAGSVAGDIYGFNLLGRDIQGDADGTCDLSTAGYRIVGDTIQFGMSLASALSTWHFCELSVLVDKDGDGRADQELAGTFDGSLRNPARDGFASFLIDAPKMRAIRARIEQGLAADTEYATAVLDEQPFVQHGLSTIAYVSAKLPKLARTAAGKLRIKLSALPTMIGADDTLDGANGTGWIEIDPNAAPLRNIAERVTVGANASGLLNLQSSGSGSLLLYAPHNTSAAGREFVFGN